MPIQYLGTIPAQTSPLTQMLQGLAGGLQTGMGYMQQAKQQKYQQAVLDLEMQKWDVGQTDKYTESMWGLWSKADEATKTMIESKVKENPVFLGEMEKRGFWWGGPEGGFSTLVEDVKTDYTLSTYGDDFLLWDKLNPEDREILTPEKAEEAKLVAGEKGYFQYTKDGVPVGESFYVGPTIDPTDIKEFTHNGVILVVDMTDPSKPNVLSQITVPTAKKTPEELLKARTERRDKAYTRALGKVKLVYPTGVLGIEDQKIAADMASDMLTALRTYYKEELIVEGFDDAEAIKISGGVTLPLYATEVHAAWVAAKDLPGRRAEILELVKRDPRMIVDLEQYPDIWDAEKGTFVEPYEEMNWLERLLHPGLPTGERPIDRWMGLDEAELKGVVPTKKPIIEAPAEVPPEPKVYPEEGVLYTPEITAAVEEAKKDSKDSGKMEALQTFLKEKGYWDYDITGKWTAILEKALREFYRDYVKKGL